MEMLTIGAFARQARLTPKALRMYDGLGLLSPVAVDAESGYRYYHPARRSTVTPSSACAYEICVPPLPVEYELCVPLLPVMVSLPPPPSKVLFMLDWI